MLLGRRQRLSVFGHIGNFVWPRAGWKRTLKYTRHRFVRLPGSPHSVAAGFACGVAVSFTPLLGFHFVGAALLAWLIGGNLVASAIGTVVGNPWTFPLIWFWILTLGRWIVGSPLDPEIEREITSSSMIGNVKGILFPMMVGGLITGPVSWFAAYYPMKYVIVSYRAARRLRLNRKENLLAAKKTGSNNREKIGA